MSFLNIFKNQLSEVIQWENQSLEVLWHQYPSPKNEIKNASKLIVKPGQGCVLVYEGKIVDIIETEGIFNLETDNHPFITSLLKIRNNFESEHKLYIYFYRRADVLNQTWGTASPIKYMDAVYNIPVEMGVNGNFSYKIDQIKHLYTSIIGSKDLFSIHEMKKIIVGRIPQFLSSYLAERKYSVQDIDANLMTISSDMKDLLNLEFAQLGLALTDFKIVGTSFDENTMERISRIADITTDASAAKQAGLDYVELEKLRALRDAARNEGGLAGAGLQFGAGMELGKAFNDKKEEKLQDNNEDVMQKLRKLKLLFDENIISQEDFETKKKELLSQL